MPQNKGRLQRHQRPDVLRNEARGVVRSRTIGRDNGSVCEATCRTNQAFPTIHSLRDWASIFLPVRVQLDPYGFRVHIIKEDLNLKEILVTLLLNGRGTESE